MLHRVHRALTVQRSNGSPHRWCRPDERGAGGSRHVARAPGVGLVGGSGTRHVTCARRTVDWTTQGAARPAAAGAARGAGPHGMGKPRRAQLHLPAPGGAAGRGLGCADVLSPVQHRATPARSCTCATTSHAGINGAESLCRELEEKGQRLEAVPCLGQCDRAPAALIVQAGTAPVSEAIVSIQSAGDVLRNVTDAGIARGEKRQDRAGSASADQVAGKAVAAHRHGGSLVLASYREHGGYQALARVIERGPRVRDSGSHRVEPAGPRRRGVPDGPQVGVGGTRDRTTEIHRLQR